MRVIQLSATAGPDGKLHLDIPAAAGEYEVAVVLTPRPAANGPAPPQTPEERGWPPGYFEQFYGSITDEGFEAPPRRSIKPIEPLDAE